MASGLITIGRGSSVRHQSCPNIALTSRTTTLTLAGHQFLVSDSTASILSNAVAIALTLTGPRLWKLLKTFFIHIFNSCARCRRRRDRVSWSEIPPHNHEVLLNCHKPFGRFSVDLTFVYSLHRLIWRQPKSHTRSSAQLWRFF